MAKKIKERLVVTPVVRNQIMEELGVSRRTVFAALAYTTEGEQPDAIRARAIELGARRQCTYTA